MTSLKRSKSALCVATAAAVLTGTVVGAAPSVAESPTSENTLASTTIQRSCVHHKFSFLSAGPYSVVSPETIEVSRPEQVRPNEVFEVVITPGSLKTGAANAGRQSYDIALPTNATLVSAQVLGVGENFRSSPAPVLTRVDANRKASQSGNFLRLWGGQSAGPGDSGSTSTSTSSGVWNAGLVADANTTYRFPPVSLRLRAPASGDQSISYGLPGSGQGGSETVASRNSLTFAEQYAVTTTLVYCGASTNASSLAQTQVLSGAPWKANSSTEITSIPEQVESTKPFTVSARVTAPDATPSQFAGTQVEFTTQDGTSLGSAAVDPSGVASRSVTLPSLHPGQNSTVHQISAAFTGNEVIESGTSPARTVEVVEKIWLQAQRSPSINVVETAEGANKKVSISSTVSGGNLPSDLRVQLYRNGEPFGESKPASGALNWTDTVVQDKNDSFAVYQVKIVELFEGDHRYFGQSAERPVLVLGSDPETDLVPGYVWTSAELINQAFLDPFGFWRAMQSGSISGS